MEAWKTEKLIKVYAATKKLDKSVATASRSPIKMQPMEMKNT